jgi:FkbM family methyltransferase
MRISLKHWLRQRREPWRKIFYDAFRQWKADKMEARRMEFSGLGANSVVLDIGGFEGNWANDIHARYAARLHVFEPHPAFATKIMQRFAGNPSITVHDFALGSQGGTLDLSDDGDASSSFRNAGRSVTGRVVPVSSFFAEAGLPFVDLAKINIEGGEYDLLPALVDAGVINRIGTIQVQFHLFSEQDIARRQAIRTRLALTHKCDWSYDFVWEQWSLRDQNRESLSTAAR